MPAQQTNGQAAKSGATKAESMAAQKPVDQALQDNCGSTANREDAIRIRAYALYEARGCASGHEAEDWLEAEAELAGAVRAPASQAGA